MTPLQIPLRRFTPVLMAVAVAALLAACGSASSSTTTSSSASNAGARASGSASRTALRTCLKAHGVTLPSRPAGGGAPGGGAPPGGGGAPGAGGFFGGGGTGSGGGGFAHNPKLAAAFKACGGNFRFRGGGRGRFRISHTAIDNYVKCVRQHGYPQMPNANFSGKGPVFPASIRTAKKFQTASRACQSILVPARPGGTGASTTSPQT